MSQHLPSAASPILGPLFALLLLVGGAAAQASYQRELVAQTGALGLVAIAQEVSINDGRRVAFVGTVIDTATAQQHPSVFADRGVAGTTQNISPGLVPATAQQIGPGVQIINNGQVCVRRLMFQSSPLGPIALTSIETWDSSIVGQVSTRLAAGPFLGTFDAVYPHPSMNNLGGYGFAAFNVPSGQLTNYLGTETSAGGFTIQLTSALPKMQMSDDNEIVLKLSGSNQIVKMPPAFLPYVTIASPSAGGFSVLGEMPGVSDDGRVVAFAGDRGAGVAVFASLVAGGARRTLRIAGEGDGFTNIALDQRVGVSAFGAEPRFKVAFVATRNGVRGLHVVEAEPKIDEWTNQWIAERRPPALAVGVGQQVGGMVVEDVYSYDPINKLGDVACHCAFVGGAAGVVRAVRSAIDLLDGSEKRLRSGVDVTADPALLSAGGRYRRGVAADGAARLVLRMPLPQAGTVRFEILGAGAVREYGSVYPCGAPADAVAATVSSVTTGQGTYAFACYRAPEDFVRAGSATDAASASREVVLRATFTPAAGAPLVLEAPIEVVRPPVVLCHGLSSDSSTWDGNPLLADPRLRIVLADYRNTNKAAFAVNQHVVPNYVKIARRVMEREEIAAVKVDWIGHSMGGLLARQHVAQGGYLSESNFSAGDLHKLLTLNTPHWGSPLANLGVSLAQNQTLRSFVAQLPFELELDGGALLDLSEGSAALAQLGPTPSPNLGQIRVPTHAVGSSGGTTLAAGAQLTLQVLSMLVPQARGLKILIKIAELAMDPATPSPFRGNDHDLVVTTPSQLGGVAAAATREFSEVETVHMGIGPIAGVTKSPLVAAHISQMLNESVHSAWFAPRIDAPNLMPPFWAPTPHMPPMALGGLALTAPGTGASIAPGQPVALALAPTGGATITQAFFFGPDGVVAQVSQPPFQATLATSATEGVSVSFAAAARMSDGTLAFTALPLTIPVTAAAALNGIAFALEEVELDDMGGLFSLPLLGAYADGVERSVYGQAGLQLSVSSPGVVAITPQGQLRPLAAGVATVRADLMGHAATCRVRIVAEPISSYGQGAAGAGGRVPRLQAAGLPRIGNAGFALTCSNLLGGAPGLFLFSPTQARIPLPGGELLVDPDATLSVFRVALGVPGVAGGGVAPLPLPVPADPALAGARLYVQAAFFDSAAALGLSASAGLRITIQP